MKKRTDGFLAQDKIDQDGEAFDYIRELHDYLWKFIRCELPFANGKLDNYLDVALEKAEEATAPGKETVGKGWFERLAIQPEDCILVAHDTGEGWVLGVENQKRDVICYLKWPKSWPKMMYKESLNNCGFEVV